MATRIDGEADLLEVLGHGCGVAPGCTYALFAIIPILKGSRTVTEEIVAWNETMKISSKSRLVRNDHRETAPAFGLWEGHILSIELLALGPETAIGRGSISDHFDPSFFLTDFG